MSQGMPSTQQLVCCFQVALGSVNAYIVEVSKGDEALHAICFLSLQPPQTGVAAGASATAHPQPMRQVAAQSAMWIDVSISNGMYYCF